MQAWNEDAAKMYASWEKDIMVEEYQIEDAELVLTAYGISARICKSVVDILRKEGYKIGMIRPITVSPFPYARLYLLCWIEKDPQFAPVSAKRFHLPASLPT